MQQTPSSMKKPPSNSNNDTGHRTQPADATNNFAQQLKGKNGISRIIKATGYSMDGFKAAYLHEAAFRQVYWLNLFLIILLILLPITIMVKMMLLIVSFLSLIVELINTGLEASIDHTSTQPHPLAKIAKDVGSAAQFLVLLLLCILWSLTIYITFF